ncbi:serine/threonine-protein kinase [Cryptosporangium aurantiacum]|uniref:non-specific serine/threonine protein kinase n=1 Tax=Cryptosporangium aurantiacum TaxID=134849 RepID=A0A1M7RM64_9ACTN|nr:serine/threonine-protein kinase [Cryptosporangium aurantiacum]SHN47178.1 Serine/threonine protein kinase [Cryptosporangium aurantiacum]
MITIDQRATASRTLVGGRYRLDSRLGSGASGTVWLAQDEELGRTVAVKEIPRELAPYPGAGRLEARAAARIDHRAVVAVYDFVAQDSDGVDWIVMEALSGRTLASVLYQYGPVSGDEARYLAEHLLDALGAVHGAGLIHGDVKPGNVQLCDDGRVVLLDFGLATVPRRTAGATDGPVAGSLPYIAPEILRSGVYSPQSDLYALGMTLYVALTGEAPDIDLTADQYRVPEIPPHAAAFAGVLRGLLDPDPDTRFDADALDRALRRLPR